MGAAHAVLGPTVAGTWYPADGAALRRKLEELFDGARGEPDTGEAPRPVALIAPHAGFVYSGTVAAHAFGSLPPLSFDRVVILGPSHYAAIRGAALPDETSYETPLGRVAIDTEAVRKLGEHEGFHSNSRPFRPEHSLEAEIPFLQHRLGDRWRLVPVLVGMLPTREDVAQLARALRSLLDGRTLVVVSSDFTHYGPRFDYVPFADDVPARIEELDRGALQPIVDVDADGFHEYVKRTKATICGRNPIRVLLSLLEHGVAGRLVAYDTSGRITGEWDHSVSYASLVFHAPARR